MLTIHTPIELKNDPSILTVGNDFGERMRANYQQIGTDLQSEDLLHLITAPPEIYLAESGEHSLVDMTNSFHSQEIKLNLINNVLNRVLLADSSEMTYQDEVFITNTLKKLGVTDVKEFMHQVQILKQETNNRNELIDIYWNYQEKLTSLTKHYEQIRQERRVSEDEQERAEETPALWLHQEIINRLQTGAIYQELRNYLSQRTGNASYLTRQELQISEQAVMAEHILLNQLKNQTTVEAMPLVYNHINNYELGDAQTFVAGGDHTVNEMIQAVLLRAVDQIYALRFDELHRTENVWYDLANAVYETAANTFERFENYHNCTELTQKDIQEYHMQMQEHQQKEISALWNLLETREVQHTMYETETTPSDVPLLYRETKAAEGAGETGGSEQTHITNVQERRSEQMIQELHHLHQGDEVFHQQLWQTEHQKHEHTEQIERLRERRETLHTIVESGVQPQESELLYGSEESGEEAVVSEIYEDARVTNENYIRHQQELNEIHHLQQGDELLRQQLNRINQQNIQRQERLHQLEQQIHQHQNIHIDRAKAQADVLRAIEHPQEVLLEYISTQTPTEVEDQESRSILREIYDEDTIRIFETVERYRREPELLLEKGIVSSDPIGQLQRDIHLQHLIQEQVTEDVSELQASEVHREVERIRTEHANRLEKENLRREVRQRSIEAVELYHKENETSIDEELLEELRTVNRQTMQSRTQVQNVIEEHHMIEEQITNRVNEMRLNNEQELAELVSRNVRQQLRGMSDQVYQKLEKRMDTERRRRGL